MKKKNIAILLLSLSLFFCIFVKNTNAVVYDRKANGYKISGTFKNTGIYYFHEIGYKYGSPSTGSYNAYLNGTDGIFICFSPDKDAGYYYTSATEVNPDSPAAGSKNTKAFYVAVIKAYQILVDKGAITSRKSNGAYNSSDRQMFLLIVRWLASKYGLLDTSHPSGSTTPAGNYKKYQYADRYRYWNTSSSIIKLADSVTSEAIKVGDKMLKGSTYKQLIENGDVWGASWQSTIPTIETNEKKPELVTISFDLESKSKISKINYDKFKVQCEYGYECKKVDIKKKTKNNKTVLSFSIVVDTSNGKKTQANNAGKPYGVVVKTNFYDFRDSSHLFLMNPTVSIKQKMLLIRDYNASMEIVTEFVPQWDEICSCQTDSNGKYTGKYELKKNINGVEKTEVFDLDDEKAKKYNCPNASKCKPDEGSKSCQTPDESDDGKYHCKDGKECSKDEYEEDCDGGKKHPSCQTPDESDDGKYHCKDGEECSKDEYEEDCDGGQKHPSCQTPDESDDGKYHCKDGEECNQDEYEDDCVCPELKDKCEENPDDPACDEYDKKCPNCSATVTVPNNCNDFDTESTVDGVISDINETASSCNPSANLVKSCVIDKKDQAGSSFEATNEIANNSYCKVWCKEKYEFSLPTAKYTQSGGYFQLTMKISAKRDCYVSGADDPDEPIDETKFLKDLEAAQVAVINAYNEYSKWNSATGGSEDKEYTWTYSIYDPNTKSPSTATAIEKGTSSTFASNKSASLEKLNSVKNKVETVINEFNSCSNGWSNNFNYNPTIEYDYYNDYLNNYKGTFEKIEGTDSMSSQDTYCSGDTDNTYTCTSGASSNVQNKNQNYMTCDASGCSSKTAQVSTAKWIQKTKIVAHAQYQPKEKFSTQTSYGIIKIDEPKCNGRDCLYTRLPDSSLPVQLTTGKGVFPFTFTFKNIGQSNENGNLGRLLGSDNSVVKAFNELPDEYRCSKDNATDAYGGYVCHYINNCDGCDFECVGDDCKFEDEEENCEGPTCPLTCVNCVFDGQEATYTFRAVSLANLFPNECNEDSDSEECRTTGYNWEVGEKAELTKKAIQEEGNNVYIEPEYSYTMNPSQLSAIREYNDKVGSYSNTTTGVFFNNEPALKCNVIEINGIQYEVECLSTFLSNGNGKYFTENKRNTEFKLWSNTEYCLSGSCLDRKKGVGPSWK